MEDKEVLNETPEVVVEETPVEAPVVDQEAKEDVPPTQQELNYKALREAKKKAENERDDFASKLKAIEDTKNNDDDDIYTDNVSKTQKELNELKQQWSLYQNQTVAHSIEQKLKTDFPDLELVVNEANIEVLKARDPHFAKITAKVMSDPNDLYNRAISAYALIKKYGIYVEDKYAKDRERVQKNLAKPRPASTAVSGEGSAGLADFAEFAGLNETERRSAIFNLARKRANQ